LDFVHLSNKKLIEIFTNLCRKFSTIQCSNINIKTVQTSNPYANILTDFPAITKPFSKSLAVNHDVLHYITTTGTPCISKSRRLPPDRLAIAKSEFRNMVEIGIFRPSSSSWSSPLHLVKTDGGWRPCGKYRTSTTKQWQTVIQYRIFMMCHTFFKVRHDFLN
jgi:hypothetical protein